MAILLMVNQLSENDLNGVNTLDIHMNIKKLTNVMIDFPDRFILLLSNVHMLTGKL